MNIQEQLLIEHSKANSVLIRDYIGHDQKRLKALLKIFIGENGKATQRAGMVISACFDRDPELFNPFVTELTENLINNNPPLAVRRNTIRILQEMEVPDSHKSQLFDYCLLNLSNPDETVAVKAFSMQLAFNICKEFPELATELKVSIEDCMQWSDRPGIKNRASRILKKLEKIDPKLSDSLSIGRDTLPGIY